MKKLSIAAVCALALLFASCVSAPKPIEKQSTEQETKSTDEEPTDETEPTPKEEESTTSDTKSIAEEKKSRDFENAAWIVRGENGAQYLENKNTAEVSGAKGVKAVLRVQSNKKISVRFDGMDGKRAVNTWSTQFSVAVKDSYDIEFVLTDVMRDGMVIFNPDNSELVHDLLLTGGMLEFLLKNDENPAENYSFRLEYPEGSYEEAFSELNARNIGN